MGFAESICYSATPAEELNNRALSLNPRLYFFAYYEPKPYEEADSNHSKFYTAIINLYGLFWDCGPFVFDLLRTSDSILLFDWSRIQKKASALRNCISAFRSIYCHNNSAQLPLNEEKLFQAERWASYYLHMWPNIQELSEADWGTLLKALVNEADSLIDDIKTAIKAFNGYADDARIESAIERWIQLIAKEYLKKPDYLLNTIAALYQLHLLETRMPRDNNRDLRYLAEEWLRTKYEDLPKRDWHVKWLFGYIPPDKNNIDITKSRVYSYLKDWPGKWAEWYNCDPKECDEAPLPASIFLRMLVQDIDFHR